MRALPIAGLVPARLLLLSLALLALGGMGCSDPASGSRAVSSAELSCASLEADGLWQSAPLDGSCPLIEFEALTTLEIPHPLGAPPQVVLVYVSFVPGGLPAVLAAGDMARIEGISTESVLIRNATEQPLFARVVLR